MPITPIPTPAAITCPPTTPPTCCCGRIPPLDDATPNPNAVAAQNLVRLAVLSGDDAWRAQADRLIEGILSAAERNLFGHVALLNALDLRLRAAEIVLTGPDGRRAWRKPR